MNKQSVFIYSAFALLSLSLLIFIAHFGVNIPWGDEWDALVFVNNARTDGFSIRELFSLHNEHRIVVIRLIMLANAALFSLNVKYQMYLSGLCLIGMSFICMRNHLCVTSGRYQLLAIIAPLLLCSFKQFENLLWGFQIGFVLSALLPVFSCHLLTIDHDDSASQWLFASAIIAGIVGSFASIQGLFVWPAAIVIIMLSKIKSWRRLVIWGATGIAVWSGYFYGYVTPGANNALSFLLKHPADGFAFFCSLTGNLLAWRKDKAFIMGALFLVAFIMGLIFLIIYKKRYECRFWIALGFFSLCVLASITLGRVSLGMNLAYESRYVTFSALFVVAVVAILASMASAIKQPGLFMIICCLSVIIFVTAPFSFIQGWQGGVFMEGTLANMRVLLPMYGSMPASALEFLFPPNPSIIKDRAPILEAMGHKIFLPKSRNVGR